MAKKKKKKKKRKKKKQKEDKKLKNRTKCEVAVKMSGTSFIVSLTVSKY